MAKPEPGRDPQMAERTQALNVVFALTSIALLLVLSWMVWADYDREWKQYQKDFVSLDKARAKKQIAEATGKIDPGKKQELEQDRVKAQQEGAAHRAEIAKQEAEIERLHGKWYAIDQNYRFTKAKIDVAKYDYEETAHKDPKHAEGPKKELDRLTSEWADWRTKLEDIKKQQADAQAKLDSLEQSKLAAEKLEKDLLGDQARLQDKLDKMNAPVTTFIRNMPVVDMLNPSLKVQQIMTVNLNDDVNFTQTPKIDRCTTCHLGIDKKGFEDAKQPFTTHPNLDLYLAGPHPIERIGCTVCHQGRGRATSFVNAAHTASTKKEEEDWGKYSHTKEYHGLHSWDLPMLTKGSTESQCVKCHQGVVEVPQAASLNTGRQLIERYGCFGCHKIKGWEDLRKVGPDLTKITSKTSEDWIIRWIKEPKSFRLTRMPQIWDIRPHETADQLKHNNVEANAVAAYIVANSETVNYPAPPPGDIKAGRLLVEGAVEKDGSKPYGGVGCMACHRIGDDHRGIDVVKTADGKSVPMAASSFRTHGPNLDGSGSKLNAGWLYAWVKNPKGYWHETKMPNLRLTDKEAADVTAYLMSLKNDEFMKRERPGTDAALRDKIILEEYLENQFSKADAKAKLAAMDEHARTLFLGEKTIGRYGCFGCHNIKGFEKTSPIGVELTEEGSKLVERLDFGFQHQIPHNLPAWVHLKVMDPRIYDEGKQETKRPEEWLRMPKFGLNDEEANAIVTAVLSFSKEQVPLAAQKRLTADEVYVEKGRRLVRNLNCQGCHQVGERGGALRTVVRDQLEQAGDDPIKSQALSPPILYNAESKIGEGARVHTAWLHDFLGDPSNKIRPWLSMRMPTFEFSEEDLNAITRYFAAQDKVAYPYEPAVKNDAATIAAGKDLFDKWQCAKCHIVGGRLPNQDDPANMAPDLFNVPHRLRAEWLVKWLADPGSVMPGTRMPANFPVDAQENAYPDILGGDQKKQIEAVRAYLLTLGKGGAATSAEAEGNGRKVASR
jgi:cytochrome c2